MQGFSTAPLIGFLNLLILCCMAVPVPYRMSASILGLYPLDPLGPSPSDNQKCIQTLPVPPGGGRITPIWEPLFMELTQVLPGMRSFRRRHGSLLNWAWEAVGTHRSWSPLQSQTSTGPNVSLLLVTMAAPYGPTCGCHSCSHAFEMRTLHSHDPGLPHG